MGANMRTIQAAITGALALAVLACGGGGGGNSTPNPTYTVGGSISGLLPGHSVVLVDNGANATSFSANGSHSYTGAIASGTAYAITVQTQPMNETCTVANGGGTIGSGNVVNVIVSCTGNPFTVSGTVSGLTGNAVVLQDNGGNATPVAANGPFAFTAAVASGSNYAVTVQTQPVGLTCTIANGSGTITGINITNVAVACSIAMYNVSVTVTGLSYGESITLQDNGADDLVRSVNGTANFSTPLDYAATYAVTISAPPATQSNCTVASGGGTITGPVNIAVNCPHFAYVSNEVDGSLSIYQIDNATGALVASGSPFATIASPYFVTTAPNLPIAYVTSIVGGGIGAYNLDVTTGALSANATFASGVESYGIAFDPAGSFAFLPNFSSGNVAVFAVNSGTGALSEIGGSPYAAGTNPDAIAVTPDGKFVYVPSGLGGNLFGFAIAVDGSLTGVPGSPVALGGAGGLAGLAIDPTGKYLYIGGNTTSNVYGYSINGVSGALSVIAGSPFAGGVNPSSISIHPNARFLYVANYGSANVSGYTIDSSSGTLSAMAGSPFAVGINPESLTIGPTGQFAYVVNSRHGASPAGPGTVSVFGVDPTSGVLSEIAGSPFPAGTNPQTLLVR
jgi:6-phosphogluconolactonase (cycloisomerase 2 family)